MESLGVKSRYAGEVRRINVDPRIKFSEFQNVINELHGLRLYQCTFKYQDSDGDKVSLDSDMELKAAVSQLKPNQPLQVYIYENGDSPPEYAFSERESIASSSGVSPQANNSSNLLSRKMMYSAISEALGSKTATYDVLANRGDIETLCLNSIALSFSHVGPILVDLFRGTQLQPLAEKLTQVIHSNTHLLNQGRNRDFSRKIVDCVSQHGKQVAAFVQQTLNQPSAESDQFHMGAALLHMVLSATNNVPSNATATEY